MDWKLSIKKKLSVCARSNVVESLPDITSVHPPNFVMAYETVDKEKYQHFCY
jgi:hypothetical protein